MTDSLTDRRDGSPRRLSDFLPPLLVGLVVLVLAMAGEPARQFLQWSRGDIVRGEWWRLVTGHFVHLDPAHAALNVAALGLLWALFGSLFRARAVTAVVIAGMVAIDCILWWLSGIDQYLGLSGVLHAFAAAAVVRRIVDRRDPLAWVIGVCGLAKIAWENLVDAMPFMGPAAVVVTDAHLAGVIAGMLAGLFLRR